MRPQDKLFACLPLPLCQLWIRWHPLILAFKNVVCHKHRNLIRVLSIFLFIQTYPYSVGHKFIYPIHIVKIWVNWLKNKHHRESSFNSNITPQFIFVYLILYNSYIFRMNDQMCQRIKSKKYSCLAEIFIAQIKWISSFLL